METLKSVQALKQIAFEKNDFDGFLIFNEANLLYFTGFPGATCLFIPKKNESTIYVYHVNYEQAKAEGKGFKIELMKRNENLIAKIAKYVKTSRIRKLAVDALKIEDHQNLLKKLSKGTEVKAMSDFVWELRRVKNGKELKLMRKAGELTSKGMKAAYETIKPGVKEYEVAAEIEYAMRRRGSCGTAFETIVASGARSAFPHGGCTDREIRKGDLVVVDIGATYNYYRSDMTRTLVAGKPSRKQEKIYETVRLAQEKAFQVIKPNVKARDIDTVARKVIADAGYGEYFVHGLGHSVGLEIHEPPTLSPESKDKLVIGNVVTNEPGIYLVGFGGVRIEDTVLVQKPKGEIFTSGPYSLVHEQ
jgi:Xaa-Pro aminopeptidase